MSHHPYSEPIGASRCFNPGQRRRVCSASAVQQSRYQCLMVLRFHQSALCAAHDYYHGHKPTKQKVTCENGTNYLHQAQADTALEPDNLGYQVTMPRSKYGSLRSTKDTMLHQPAGVKSNDIPSINVANPSDVLRIRCRFGSTAESA